jgi:signal transduction histidine kinase
MQALWKHLGDENARRAWIGVGAPILVLVMVIIVLAIGTFASFARQQDQAFVETSTRLTASASERRADALKLLVVDFANWDAAVANITTTWNEEWVQSNIYSSTADAMFVFRADGEVRHAWFGEAVAGQESELQHAAIDAAVAIPNLRRLARAATPGDTAARTYAIKDGRWIIVAVSPVTVEDNAQRIGHARSGVYDYIAAVSVVTDAGLARAAAALDLHDLVLLGPEAAPATRSQVRYPLRSADGEQVGALQWRHTYPGARVFQGKIWLVVNGLLFIGILTILIARHLVSRQIEAISNAKAALDSSREKSDFLARVSNELRTPLNAVIGYAELIQEVTDSPAANEDAQCIIDAARQLGVMLNDIIDQSRIDAGHMQLKPEVLPVAGMLAEIQGLMHPIARAAGVDVTISQEAVACYAYADHARLRQCLLNIVGNAVKFSQRGAAVRLRARLAREAERDVIVLEVRDTGIGIRPEEMPVIFRPFGQANGAIGAVYGGTGLGLSISRALARDMGGDISVVSAPGEGTTFYLRVPAATARALSAA